MPSSSSSITSKLPLRIMLRWSQVLHNNPCCESQSMLSSFDSRSTILSSCRGQSSVHCPPFPPFTGFDPRLSLCCSSGGEKRRVVPGRIEGSITRFNIFSNATAFAQNGIADYGAMPISLVQVVWLAKSMQAERASMRSCGSYSCGWQSGKAGDQPKGLVSKQPQTPWMS